MATVHCLVTCRDASLLPASTLVFKTFRVGFPTSKLRVYINEPSFRSEIVAALPEGTEVEDISTIHHTWIEFLVATEQEPFWIVDADVSFWSKVEDWTFEKPLAGRLIPEFRDEFSRCITRSRLHPSLMRIDPVKVRDQIKTYHDRVYNSVFTPHANLFYPCVFPLRDEPYFHDTTSLLYHAIGGQAFTDRQLGAYDHLHFGSIPDVVLPQLSDGAAMAAAREECIKNPESFKGVWRQQEAYFAARQPFLDGKKTVASVNKEDAQEAYKWNVELCCGNQEAMSFCDAWYRYCHSIDDCIDEMEDGHITLSKDEIIGTFFQAAMLYNSPFWRQYSNMLFPLVLNITDDYATSVQWEKSPLLHRRVLANTLRQCGNRMYSMIALIAGGPEHMKTMSRKIQERDYVAQNYPDGTPR